MVEETLDRLDVGKGSAAREIAIRSFPGKTPGIFWLGGFKSDMKGTKAEALAEHARKTGRAYTRFDYSGHGESGGDFRDGTISRWAEEARAVFARVSGPQILVGSSMGGWIALLLARALQAEPSGKASLKGMVLIAPAPDFTEALMWPQLSEDAKRDVMEKGFWLRPSEYGDGPYPLTRALFEDGRNNLLMDKPLQTGCPVRVLQGAADPDVPYRHALKLVTCFAQDDVVLTLIKDGDHRLSRPEDLERLMQAVDELAEA
ncbi:MAG TPA: alpha/beta hydrolase [Xanthobacteraceae bacterium]|jgi:pimeloyl-ACP methyl ester carboxylesterase|nr:alpha/beta hydrolase [Xanthobacteraceae bacterium]